MGINKTLLIQVPSSIPYNDPILPFMIPFSMSPVNFLWIKSSFRGSLTHCTLMKTDGRLKALSMGTHHLPHSNLAVPADKFQNTVSETDS